METQKEEKICCTECGKQLEKWEIETNNLDGNVQPLCADCELERHSSEMSKPPKN